MTHPSAPDVTFVDDQTNTRRIAILRAMKATRTETGPISTTFEDALKAAGYIIVPIAALTRAPEVQRLAVDAGYMAAVNCIRRSADCMDDPEGKEAQDMRELADTIESIRANDVRRAVTALAAPPVDGQWVLVPKEPTKAMHKAAWDACENDMKAGKDWPAFNAKLWRAMCAARPAAED